jgi:hypothetical protein
MLTPLRDGSNTQESDLGFNRRGIKEATKLINIAGVFAADLELI